MYGRVAHVPRSLQLLTQQHLEYDHHQENGHIDHDSLHRKGFLARSVEVDEHDEVEVRDQHVASVQRGEDDPPRGGGGGSGGGGCEVSLMK